MVTPSPVAQTSGAFSSFLLLTDGTVMCQAGYPNSGSAWYKLTPDIHGSYANGTFTQLSSMNDTRLYYATQVMQNGNVFVAGGEYGTGGNKSEIYNPLTDTWTEGPNNEITMGISDSISILLNDGSVLIGSQNADCQIYNPTSNSFGTQFEALQGLDEADWNKLPDDSILCVDDGSWGGTTFTSERYIPSQGQWVDDALLPIQLYSATLFEIGQQNLLPNGKVFVTGGTPATAIYTPSGNASPGSWVAGPAIPGGLGESDAPSASLVDGNVLFDAGESDSYSAPTSFFLYNYQDNTITQINGPTGATDNIQPFVTTMLNLPDGTVLYQGSDNIYFYTPPDSALTSGQPVINSVVPNNDGSYTLTGTGLNGLNQGAQYGDDKQMDSNYPIVRLTSNTTSDVYYARTFNWSSTSVQTGTKILTTQFTLPANIPSDDYSLVVVANGNASSPLSISLGAAPLNVTATAGDASVEVSWSAVGEASSYDLYRSTSSGNEQLYKSGFTGTSAVDTGLTNGTKYYYKVAANFPSGPGALSSEVSATPFQLPATTLTATAGNQQVSLSWTSVANATGYNVYRGTSAGGEGSSPVYSGVTGTSLVDTGVTDGTTYYYEVSPVSVTGVQGTLSNEVSARPLAAATFVKTDTSTGGNWKGVYGGDGWNVIGDTSGNNPTYPSYATVTPGTHLAGVWDASSLSSSALQSSAAGSANRVAGVWYQKSWTMNVNVTGGAHQLALYLLDINNAGFAETITLKDAVSGTVLDTRSASSFQNGEYYVWNVSGNITVSFSETAGGLAVLNGIFLGAGSGQTAPSTPASPTATPGDQQIGLTWTASAGATSYNLYRGTASGAESTTPVATGITGTSYANTGLTAGSTYYYKLIAVNAVGGSFASSEVSAKVPTGAVSFLKTDTSTQGNWKGVYGADGWNVIGDPSANNPSNPSYATVTPGSHLAGVWAASSLSPAALQSSAVGSTNRLAGVWYQTSWSTVVNVTGTHQIALYLVDIDNLGIAETITVKDTATGVVLDTRQASSFQNGEYYVWNVSGSVTVTLTSTAGHWAVLNGIFFGGAAGSTAPSTPSGLSAAPGNQQITLSWAGSTNATSYNIYRGTAAGAESTTPIATGVTGSTYTNAPLTGGGTYYYKVVAVNATGGSFASNEASATVPSGTVSFIQADTSTQGNWKGVYGGDGWNVIGDTSSNNPTYPSYATVAPGSHLAGVWTASSLSPSALQSSAAGSSNRLVGVWYQTSWSVGVNVSGTHQVALYLVDIDNLGIGETITVKDTASGTVLDSRSASGFQSGVYYVWNVSGSVTITLTSTAGHWAVLNGIFLGGATGSTAPTEPAGLSATPTATQVALTWNVSTGASSYNVYRGTASGSESTSPVASGLSSPAYTDTHVTAGSTYYYQVVGVNAVGGSFASSETSAVVP